MRKFDLKTLATLSLAATGNSDPIQFNEMLVCSIQTVWTGSPGGSLKLQISNDKVTWSDYTGSSTAVSATGDFTWNISGLASPWVRLAYTRTSGTGSATITASMKRDG